VESKNKAILYPGWRGEVKFPLIRIFRYNINRDPPGVENAEVVNAEMSVSRIALVTGAGRGIGRAVALRLAGEPEITAVATHFRSFARDAEATAAEVRKLGKEAETFKADFSRAEAAAAMMADVEARLGPVDILVNNVGPFFLKPWTELEDGDWEKAFNDNLLSTFRAVRAVLPGMRSRRWGRIVNLGFSRVGQNVAFPNIAPYAAAKSSLLILTRTAAVAEADRGITVNMVSPGLIEGGVLPAGAKLKAMDVGKPADVAEAVAFLASDRAAAVTGTNLIVSGTWKM
jgi:3-oxoacyl-[acyl-carrier protein] reductase